MLQFALMLLSANALTCNVWITANGMKSQVTQTECVDTGGVTFNSCVSFSYKSTMTGQSAETSVNTGNCGYATFCDDTKKAAELAGTVTDWKCGTCTGDNCNTEATADGGNSGGGDKPAATSKKNWHLELAGGDGADHCIQLDTADDCSREKLDAADDGFKVYKEGSCPAGYSMECAMGIKDGPSYPDHATAEQEKNLGCGKATRTLKTKDCAGCTSMKDAVDEGQVVESGPTCSSGSALAFGLAALVASLLF